MPLLLTPVIALLLTLAAEAMVVALHDAPVPVGETLAGAAELYLFRKLGTRATEDVKNQRGSDSRPMQAAPRARTVR